MFLPYCTVRLRFPLPGLNCQNKTALLPLKQDCGFHLSVPYANTRAPGALYAEKLKSKGAVVKTFNTSDLACMELKNKGADAVISDLPVLQYFLKNGGSEYAKLAGEPLTAEDYGIVIFKKKPELAKEVDKALDTLKKNGTYDKLYEKWFGSKPAK